ncbi:LysM peptidoglycan-binding domain-containing protein [Saccharopolyspora rosea]|uniref:LysM peptidoglycan-binding domain-containing protein n=1 Tax=Saccharopolyspora rosea TaxID=524884 RepID=UPI0021D9DD93|nr:LysM peptidoglycan-binding domain-containing protein [Saccharopolyspora rosea]
MTGLRALLRWLTAASGLVFAVLVLPTGLVLATQAAPWPHGLTPPPLDSGMYRDSAWADFEAWLVATYHEIRLQLPVDDVVVLGGLLVLWGLWAALICCIVTDTCALIRYGAQQLCTEDRHGVRGWITAVVTSTVLVGTAAPSVASALPSSPVAASAPRHPGGPQRTPEAPRVAPATDGPAPDPSVAGPAVHVHRGDSLWTLAKEHLGDGNRWREITDLNPQLAPQPQFLRAGQWLRMPDDAVRLQPPPVPDGARWVTVASGDTLAGLAERYLGEAWRWPEIFELNRGRTQPDHHALHNPEILFPGWLLAIPRAEAPDNPTPPGQDTPAPPPTPTSPSTPPPAPALAGSAAAPRPEPAPASQPRVRARVVEGVVIGLIAAGTLTAAAYRWRRRRTSRAPAAPPPTVYSLPIALKRTHLRTDQPAAISAPPTGGECEAEHAEPPPAGRVQARVTVFGSPRLYWRPETEAPAHEVVLQPRMVSLLTFLALHPRGAGREEILEALWGEHAAGSNALNTTLTRLGRTLSGHDPALAELVVAGEGRRCRINPELTTVDYWEFTTAHAARRQARSDDERATADQEIISAYAGWLADGLDAPWAEPARAHAHRAFLDAIAGRAHDLRETAPQHALDMLEHAREFAPDHEPLYRDIMRLQARLGLYEAIPRTLELLHTSLAALGTVPSNETRALAEQLRRERLSTET